VSDTRQLRPRDPDLGGHRHEKYSELEPVDDVGHHGVTEAADAGDRAAADTDTGPQKRVGPDRRGQKQVQTEGKEAQTHNPRPDGEAGCRNHYQRGMLERKGCITQRNLITNPATRCPSYPPIDHRLVRQAESQSVALS
jgi:hypothetical protein